MLDWWKITLPLAANDQLLPPLVGQTVATSWHKEDFIAEGGRKQSSAWFWTSKVLGRQTPCPLSAECECWRGYPPCSEALLAQGPTISDINSVILYVCPCGRGCTFPFFLSHISCFSLGSVGKTLHSYREVRAIKEREKQLENRQYCPFPAAAKDFGRMTGDFQSSYYAWDGGTVGHMIGKSSFLCLQKSISCIPIRNVAIITSGLVKPSGIPTRQCFSGTVLSRKKSFASSLQV